MKQEIVNIWLRWETTSVAWFTETNSILWWTQLLQSPKTLLFMIICTSALYAISTRWRNWAIIISAITIYVIVAVLGWQRQYLWTGVLYLLCLDLKQLLETHLPYTSFALVAAFVQSHPVGTASYPSCGCSVAERSRRRCMMCLFHEGGWRQYSGDRSSFANIFYFHEFEWEALLCRVICLWHELLSVGKVEYLAWWCLLWLP